MVFLYNRNGDNMKYNDLFDRLAQSTFRSRFVLGDQEKEYVYKKGRDVMEKHARAFIKERLSPAYIENDGKQTPMKGHPIFIGQHATACCCRGCLEKWHHIPKNRALTKKEQDYICDVLMCYLDSQMEGYQGPKKEYEQMSLF